MVAASALSNKLAGLSNEEEDQIIRLLKQYELPVHIDYDTEKIWNILLNDKKRQDDTMLFILLNKIGDGIIQPIPLVQLKQLLQQKILS